MTGETDKSPFTRRMGLAPMVGAAGFVVSGLILERFFPDTGTAARFCVQAAVALGIAFPVGGYWRKTPRAPVKIWTRILETVFVWAWPIAFAAWCVGWFIEGGDYPAHPAGDYTVPLRGVYLTPLQAAIDDLAIRTFIGAGMCWAAAGFLSNLLHQRQTWIRREPRDIPAVLRSVLVLAVVVASFVASGRAIHAIIPSLSPGLVLNLQIVVGLVAFGLAGRVLIRVDPADKPAVPPIPLRIFAAIVGLSFVTSFFVLLYQGTNVRTQPDHRVGEYTVLTKFKDGSRRYSTPEQSLIDEIASWTLFGSFAGMFLLQSVIKRRGKKLALPAEPPAASE
jgi:hypothetical protein